MRTAKKRRK